MDLHQFLFRFWDIKQAKSLTGVFRKTRTEQNHKIALLYLVFKFRVYTQTNITGIIRVQMIK